MRILQDSSVLEELILLAGYISDDNEEAAGKFMRDLARKFQMLADN